MHNKKLAPFVFAFSVIAAAFAVGLYFKHATPHVDHPLEQISEKILDSHGIDVDFSDHKKKKVN